MKLYIQIICGLLLWTIGMSASALPQFSLLTGDKCASCHVAPQGGGLRSDLGAYARNEISLISPESAGLGWLYALDAKKNTLLDGQITFGMDFRLQMAKSHRTEDAEEKIFPMQAAIYSQYAPAEWIAAEVTINVGHKRFGNTQTNNYPGQQPWEAAVTFRPSQSMPSLRIGMIQPTIGIRYDDHTKITRQAPSAGGINSTGTSSIIPPLYAEYGAEISYDAPRDWTLSAGVFGSRAISEVQSSAAEGKTVSLISDKNIPSLALRAVYWPHIGKNFNSFAGASYFANDDFSMINGFIGIGVNDMFSLTADYAYSDKKNIRHTQTISLEAMFQALESLMLCARIEGGTSTISGKDEYTNQLVLGVQAFLLPCIELRPEYRIMDTDNFRSGRWAAQLHIFY